MFSTSKQLETACCRSRLGNMKVTCAKQLLLERMISLTIRVPRRQIYSAWVRQLTRLLSLLSETLITPCFLVLPLSCLSAVTSENTTGREGITGGLLIEEETLLMLCVRQQRSIKPKFML